MKTVGMRLMMASCLISVMSGCIANQRIAAPGLSSPQAASDLFSRLPKNATANEVWPRIVELATLRNGYITRDDLERVIGEKVDEETSDRTSYTVTFKRSAMRNYEVTLRVEPLTHTPFNEATSSRIVETKPSSRLYVTLLGSDCLQLQKVRGDLAAAGIVFNEWVSLPTIPGPPPMPPGAYFYRPGREEFVIATMTSIETAYRPTACVGHIEVNGYKTIGNEHQPNSN